MCIISKDVHVLLFRIACLYPNTCQSLFAIYCVLSLCNQQVSLMKYLSRSRDNFQLVTAITYVHVCAIYLKLKILSANVIYLTCQ